MAALRKSHAMSARTGFGRKRGLPSPSLGRGSLRDVAEASRTGQEVALFGEAQGLGGG
jgi:hypothetical protein